MEIFYDVTVYTDVIENQKSAAGKNTSLEFWINSIVC